MSASWEVASATQITRSGAATRLALATRLADHIEGGWARVIHSLCCPVGGQPDSPRKSQSKSQRGQISGDTQLRQALSSLVKCPLSHTEPRPAMPGTCLGVMGSAG